jgi:hypothetical protein
MTSAPLRIALSAFLQIFGPVQRQTENQGAENLLYVLYRRVVHSSRIIFFVVFAILRIRVSPKAP